MDDEFADAIKDVSDLLKTPKEITFIVHESMYNDLKENGKYEEREEDGYRYLYRSDGQGQKKRVFCKSQQIEV